MLRVFGKYMNDLGKTILTVNVLRVGTSTDFLGGSDVGIRRCTK